MIKTLLIHVEDKSSLGQGLDCFNVHFITQVPLCYPVLMLKSRGWYPFMGMVVSCRSRLFGGFKSQGIVDLRLSYLMLVNVAIGYTRIL